MSARDSSFSRVAARSNSSARCLEPAVSVITDSSLRIRSLSARAAASSSSTARNAASASALAIASALAAALVAAAPSAASRAAASSASVASRRACSLASCSCTIFISWSLASSRFSYSWVRLPRTDSSTGPIASSALSGPGVDAPRGGVGVWICCRPIWLPSVHIRSRSIAVHCCISRVTPTAAATPFPAAIFRGGVVPSYPSPGVPYSLPGVMWRL
mmetsp:Transcript_2464/g.4371  ORF Transcript_2464/g.4371 Transcript_2464/m.4371 type:complete len:217 (-) Transcript_2464:803-1453(-)